MCDGTDDTERRAFVAARASTDVNVDVDDDVGNIGRAAPINAT
jgi:hypothetical protein